MYFRGATRGIGLALLALLATAAPAAAAPAVSGEFPLGSEVDGNNKLAEGPDGNVWVTLSGVGKDVARVTPAGAATTYDLIGEGAQGIATGPEGRLWVSRTGGLTSFAPGDPEGTDVGTAIAAIATFHSLVLAPDGNLWVASAESLIRVPPANPAAFKAFAVAGLSPRDIDVAGSLLAVADFGGARVLTATLADPPLTVDYKLKGGSQGVAGGAGGQIALSQQGEAPTELGLLTPPGPPLLTASPGTDPFGVALGSDGAFWVAQFAADTLTRLTAGNQVSNLAPGFAAGAGPRQVAPGPGSTLWVTLDNVDKVGRVSGVEEEAVTPPAPPGSQSSAAPRTRISAGPSGKVRGRARRARVRFRFASPDPGAGFQCRLRQLPRHKAAKRFRAPKFKRCGSPRTYRLRPGRYRFEVRAVRDGRADPTPARRGFAIVRVGARG